MSREGRWPEMRANERVSNSILDGRGRWRSRGEEADATSPSMGGRPRGHRRRPDFTASESLLAFLTNDYHQARLELAPPSRPMSLARIALRSRGVSVSLARPGADFALALLHAILGLS